MTHHLGRPSDDSNEPLAIVGIGCRLPGNANDAESFWGMLASGRSGIIEIPADRWNKERYYHPETAIPNRMHSKWGGFVDRLDQFDARFWGISPREAARMDPQQRWLLEVAWEAIEDAGIAPANLAGTNTGVYVGISSSDYAQIQMTHHEGLDVHSNSGNTLSIASNRISYMLDLKGPSISVDTACSSSLVAMSLAAHSIWDGACDAALIGGANAVVVPSTTMAFSKATMLSPDGQCFAFDSRANGYVRGEGAGAVFIKRLSAAQNDGDPIYAVVRAAVTNQDGKTSSMMVPGIPGQTAMLEKAYEEAGVPPHLVRYAEAHGTGTPTGDPIEATALGNVLSRGRAKDDVCLIGSAKTNVGHLEAGSGMAGMIKAALVLHKDQVPPNLNYDKPNPKIPLERLQLKVADKLQPLPHLDGERPLAAVNSFGFGGTNSHLVLEAAPEPTSETLGTNGATTNGSVAHANGSNGKPQQSKIDRPYLLPISARDDAALRNYVTAYARQLRDPSIDLAELCYSAGERKEHHPQRLAIIGHDHQEMRDRLSGWLSNPEGFEGTINGAAAKAVGPITFVFTGQGSQWWAMGQQLLAREPVVRETIERIDALISKHADWSLLEEMTRGESESAINETYIAQPAIFGLQVALAELWKSWGVTPDKVIGHSVGEVAAAYVAGIYTLEDAVTVIVHRSRLQHTTGGSGRMLAAGVSAAQARELIGDKAAAVGIAAINSPTLVTLSGDTGPLEEIAKQLEADAKFFRWLPIDYAFHTHQMDPIKDELLEALKDIAPQPGHVPMISTVTGGVVLGEKLDANYWWLNVREPVLFAAGMTTAMTTADGEAEGVFLEIGPHPALRSSIDDCLSDQNHRGTILHSLRRNTDESQEILANLAGLHCQGVKIDWTAVNQAKGELVRLPSYPWSLERCWIESEHSSQKRLAATIHPLLGLRIDAVEPTWEFALDPRLFPYLNDHQIWDGIVFPAAGFGEIGLALAKQLFPEQPHVVESVEILKALFVFEDKPATVRIVFSEVDKSFKILSASGDRQEWDVHATGKLIPSIANSTSAVDLDVLRESLGEYIDHERYYAGLLDAGYGFGPTFREIQNVWAGKGEALAEIDVPEEIQHTTADYHFHPAVLDACFQAFRATQTFEDASYNDLMFLPAAIRRLRTYTEEMPTKLWAHAVQRQGDHESMTCDIYAFDEAGQPVADILGFRVDVAERKSESDDIESCLYQFEWQLSRLRGTGADGSCEFTAPQDIAEAAKEMMPALCEEYQLIEYAREYTPRSAKVIAQYIQNGFIDLGWEPKVGDKIEFESFVRKLGIVKQRHRLARVQLVALEDQGILKRTGHDQWEIAKQPIKKCTKADVAALERDYPRLAPTELKLSKKNGEFTAEILSGEVNPVELLFPGGNSAVLGDFYVDALDFPAINRLLAKAVAEAVKNLPPRRALRILEIGAGTGSLSSHVLPLLPADRTEYVYTDIGQAFMAPAKMKFEKYPFIDYRVFDLEKPATEQGYDLHSFDLILASDVFHATKDLRRSFENAKSLLAEDGLLIFIELIAQTSGTDSIFGGLPGWWAFEDFDIRPNHALMPIEQWLSFLDDCGFRDVSSIIAVPERADAQQTVLVMKAPQDVSKDAEGAGGQTGEADVNVGTHVVFADSCGFAEQLLDQLTTAGERAALVKLGDEYSANAGSFTVSTGSDEDLKALFEAIGPVATVTHCGCLDQPPADELNRENLESSQETGVMHALRVGRVLGALELPSNPRVFFITRDAQVVTEEDTVAGLASAPIIGFARVANSEHTNLRWTVVDLAKEAARHEAESLRDELLVGDGELEIAYRGTCRYANRLHRVRVPDLPRRSKPAKSADGAVVPYRLQIDKPGVLTNLSLNVTKRVAPGPSEIEVEMAAGGINFRDVMKALGMYPGNPVDVKWFGDDFAGTVTRVGDSVTQFAVGDRVAGMSPYCFRTYARSDWRTAFKIPHEMPFQGAATLPTVFLTAHYAINYLARMQKGESILIHAAAGGVGQAAIQIAQHLGLEVFATAGTDEKRQLIRDMGVTHIMNSRTLDFADEIMEITSGRGVDAVLNSLAGPFVPKNASVLAPFGRFLEIGKIDVYGNTKIGLESLKDNISYFIIDLAQALEHKRDLVASMFAELADRFEAGDYKPLSHTIFPISDVVEAFRFMAQGKHIGKNVLDFESNQESISIGPCTEDGHLFAEDGSYLISGGASGFGLEVVKWMAKNGAKHIVLMSRSGPRDAQAQDDIASMRESGVNIVDARGDVTKVEDVERVVGEIKESLPPLKGVLHGAMVLEDTFIVDMTEECFTKVMNPKMLGAWNLHTATLDCELDHFICFSSFSAVAGAAKQSNYNAGNLFIDQLAAYRHRQGLPALTYNWGGISGAGFVHRNASITQYFDKIGFHNFDLEEALELIQTIVEYDPVNLAAGRLNWQKMERFSAFIAASPMYQLLTQEAAGDGGGASMRPLILAAAPEERLGMVRELLTKQLSEVCSIDTSKIDPDTSIIKLGLDSLMAIEMINRVENELGLVLPMGKVLGGPTLTELGETVVQLLAYSAGDEGDGDAGGSGGSGSFDMLETDGEGGLSGPLSERQQAVWFCEQVAGGEAKDNVSFVASVQSTLDIDSLQAAYHGLCERHPILSARFEHITDLPQQHLGEATPSVTVVDGADLKEVTKHANMPFELMTGPPARLVIISKKNSTVLLLVAHRLIADEVSVAALANELLQDYQKLVQGERPDTEPTKFSYTNFVTWETTHLESDASQKSLGFWKEHLKSVPQRLNLPVKSGGAAALVAGQYDIELDDQLAHKLLVLATEQDVSLRTALLTVFELAMHKVSGQRDLVVGYASGGRTASDLASAVGRFSNPVPLRSNVDDSVTFLELLNQNKKLLVDSLEHQDYPLARVLTGLEMPRTLGESPLYQAAFAMHGEPANPSASLLPFLVGRDGHKVKHGDLTLESVAFQPERIAVPLLLRTEESSGTVFGCWQYDTGLFDREVIATISEAFVQVLESVVATPYGAVVDVLEINDVAAPEADAIEYSAYAAPRSETEHYVTRLCEELLDVKPIGIQDSLFLAGANSLSMTVLAAQCSEVFGVDIPLQVIFAGPTISALSAYIDEQRGDDAPPILDPTEKKFAADGVLPADIVAPADTTIDYNKFDRVLLTGASGFLGAFVLDELLKHTQADIYCLVRASSARHGMQRITKNLEKYGLSLNGQQGRVIPVVGDLSKPRLGLSDEQFETLGNDIDVIYHNGAVLNFAYGYEVMRDANVLGTHEVLRLAMMKRLKPVHYVSTIAVQGSVKRSAWEVVSEKDPLPAFSSLKDGYSQTKWMSEKVIADARERGLPVAIYRPGGVTGDSRTGKSNTGDMMHVMVLGCFHLGTIPSLDVELNLAPVDFVASALVQLSKDENNLGKTFHLVNPEPLRIDALVNFVKQTELPVQRMPAEHWRDQVAAHMEALPSDVFGLLTKAFLPGVIEGESADAVPAVLQLRYDSAHTQQGLKGSKIQCPPLDNELMGRYFEHLQDSGLVTSNEEGSE